MVKAFFLLFLFLPMLVAAQQVRVFAEVDRDPLENTPIMGNLSIEHPNTAVVNKKSIQLQNKPLVAEQIKEVRYSPNDPLTLTIYRFQLPPLPKGLQLLESISVEVGGKNYKTVPNSFEVKKASNTTLPAAAASAPDEPPQRKNKKPEKKSKPLLVLEAFVDPNISLYPGQRTKVGYRYYFNQNIQATHEELPLLDAEGFKKIGGKVTRSAQEGDMSLLEISQEIEAVKEGDYSFGPSYYTGIAKDENGNDMLPAIKSETPAIKISVTALPQNIKPPSYKNAIGQYTMETSLDSPTNVEVGEKMMLKMTIKGSPLEGVDLPDLCCQPGMAGRFHMSDIPPAPQLKTNSVQFLIEIRPMDAELKEIPSLEFSFFNPDKGVYERVFSKPIPITVRPIVIKDESTKASDKWPTMNTIPQPIPIAGLKEFSEPFFITKWLLSWWGLLMIPLAAGFIFFQMGLKRGLLKIRARESIVTSKHLLNAASKTKKEQLPGILKECFLLKLQENGEIIKLIPYEQLSDNGNQGKVKSFLRKIDAWHYTDNAASPKPLLSEAYSLYKELSK